MRTSSWVKVSLKKPPKYTKQTKNPQRKKITLLTANFTHLNSQLSPTLKQKYETKIRARHGLRTVCYTVLH